MKVGCWFEKYHIVPFKITKRGKNKHSVSCLRNKKKKHLSSEAEIRTFWNCKSCWLVDNNWYLLLIDSGCLGTPRLIIISNSQKVNCQFWPLKQQKHPFSCFRRRVTLFHFKSNCCNWLVFSVTHLFCSFYFEIKKKQTLWMKDMRLTDTGENCTDSPWKHLNWLCLIWIDPSTSSSLKFLCCKTDFWLLAPVLLSQGWRGKRWSNSHN